MALQNSAQNGEGNESRFKLSQGPVVGPGLPDFPLPSSLNALARETGFPLLFAIPRDPQTVFVYWSVDWDRAFAKGQPVDQQVFLRVRNEDGSEEREVVVEPLLGSDYVAVESPGSRYQTELGYYDAQRGWTSVATSEVVETPRQSASDNAGLDLATVPFHLSFQRLIDIFRASNGNALGSIMSRLQAHASREIKGDSLGEETEILRAMDLSVKDLTAAKKSFADDEALRRKTEAVLGFGATSPGAGFGDVGGSPAGGSGESSWS